MVAKNKLIDIILFLAFSFSILRLFINYDIEIYGEDIKSSAYKCILWLQVKETTNTIKLTTKKLILCDHHVRKYMIDNTLVLIR